MFPRHLKIQIYKRVHKKGRCLHKQISDFFDTILSKYQCGFRNGHGAQHRLIALPEKWQESID